MINSLPIQETEQDLHIANHIDSAELPAMVQPIMSLANSDSERDMLLLSLLTAAGSCMPNLYFRYGLTGKRYYPNLQCFIVGSAACGKGIANLALDFVLLYTLQGQLISSSVALIALIFSLVCMEYRSSYLTINRTSSLSGSSNFI